MRTGATLAAVSFALGGCNPLGEASLPGLGGPAGPAGLEDRVWLAEDPGTEGALRVFLSDGTLLTADCRGGYRLDAWRRIDASTVAWETEAGVVRAEIAVLGPRELALVSDPSQPLQTEAYRRAQSPLNCAGLP